MRELSVTDLLDVGAGDELGTPADHLETCECGVTYRAGGAHRCELAGAWVDE